MIPGGVEGPSLDKRVSGPPGTGSLPGSARLITCLKRRRSNTRQTLSLSPWMSQIWRRSGRRQRKFPPQPRPWRSWLITPGFIWGTKPGPWKSWTWKTTTLQQTMEVNARPLGGPQQFLALWPQGEKKIIINISSEAGSIGDCWRAEVRLHTPCQRRLLTCRPAFSIIISAPGGSKGRAPSAGSRTDMGGKEARP